MRSFLKTNNRKRISVYQLIFFVSIILFTTSAYAITYVSSPIIVPSDTVINGNYETFQAQGISSCGSIYFLHSVHNVVIENVIIDANDSDLNTMIHGIHVSGVSSNITIRNCIFKNCEIAIGTGSGWGTDMEQLHIENCIFEQCKCVMNIQDPVSYMYISDCTITKCNRGIIMEAKGRGLGAINHIFADNVKISEIAKCCYPIQWCGIRYFRLNNVFVFGNNVTAGEGGTADQFALYGCQDGVVSNCHSEGGGDLGFAAPHNQYVPSNAERILFIGNTALKNATAGFFTGYPDVNDIMFINNFSLGNRDGIFILNGFENVASQNICRDNTKGIWICSGAVDTLVTENILLDNETTLDNSSSSAVVEHNIPND